MFAKRLGSSQEGGLSEIVAIDAKMLPQLFGIMQHKRHRYGSYPRKMNNFAFMLCPDPQTGMNSRQVLPVYIRIYA